MVGQFKDDQIKNHRHYLLNEALYTGPGNTGWTNINVSLAAAGGMTQTSEVSMSTNVGSTTRTKQKGVKFIIKAL